MRFNLFYPAVALVGVALVFLFQPPVESELNFYGFAESNETAINYNYPVVVEEILVRPGQAVKAGEVLLQVSRRRSKETLADQEFRIRELQSEESIWRGRKQDELAETDRKMTDATVRLSREIEEAERKLDYQRSLSEGLTSVTVPTSNYRPQEDKIIALKEELARTQVQGKEKEQSLRRELNLGGNPYRAQIDRLSAEAQFDEGQRVQPFAVTAPSDGLIGNLSVKEEEHVPSYETLLSFYEPHSGIVRGYLHEDQTLRVETGDKLEVFSLKNPELIYAGTVVGLGSRIVSIPTRLRKLPDFETYGREVIVEITLDNGFLQKEKVGLRTPR
ncbi:HlyD family secretion protein [Neolewinella antarctica]|uniref:Multidrug resistance efflux pump n=1 Tax=Neolewinella antarctica TaxID=442734 RepID=A0ABX0XGP9_9BACT|nr:HlyD family efflux transporter periplasmic adaptor subunit [Neolewinella antarctica]NJC28372.1 multidrug resistance efflux pump [Neolewinella antarctica]